MTPRVEAWIRQANNDLEAAGLTAGQGFHAQACYQAGQAAEKALKALLLAAGITPPYSHSLENWWSCCNSRAWISQPWLSCISRRLRA